MAHSECLERRDLMRSALLRDPIFMIGFAIFVSLLLLSIGNTVFRDGQVDQFLNRYSDEGRLIGIPPLEPSKDQWLGTDRAGNDLFQMMIEGFKWTVGICAVVDGVRPIDRDSTRVSRGAREPNLQNGVRRVFDSTDFFVGYDDAIPVLFLRGFDHGAAAAGPRDAAVDGVRGARLACGHALSHYRGPAIAQTRVYDRRRDVGRQCVAPDKETLMAAPRSDVGHRLHATVRANTHVAHSSVVVRRLFRRHRLPV